MQEADRILTAGTTPAHRPAEGAPKNEPELIVKVHPGDCAFFRGTAAQLIEEGIVPADFVFPRGRASADLPKRPGVKIARIERAHKPGSGRGVRCLDYWSVVTYAENRLSWEERLVAEAQEEVERRQRHISPEGRAQFDRYWIAHKDAAFQKAMDFKGLISAARAAS